MDNFDIAKENLFNNYEVVTTVNIAPSSDTENPASPTETDNLFANFDDVAVNESHSDLNSQIQGKTNANVLHNGENWIDIPVLQGFAESFAETKALLIEWNLEHLTPLIEAHKLDLSALIYIKERHFDQIGFETLGDKVKFEHHVEKFQREQSSLLNGVCSSQEKRKPQNVTQVSESRNQTLPASSAASSCSSSELTFNFQSVSIIIEFNKL